jgi:hypothetical protein
MPAEEGERSPLDDAHMPGYTIQVAQDKKYLVLAVLERQNLSLAQVEMPNLSQALQQDGGVST